MDDEDGDDDVNDDYENDNDDVVHWIILIFGCK